MKPYIINLKTTSGKGGHLTFIENPEIPFDVKRLYWIYDLKDETKRGGHAHMNSDRVLICLSGSVEIILENKKCIKHSYLLNNPGQALFFPRKYWIHMTCRKNTIILALVSCRFSKDEKETNPISFFSE